MHYVNADEFFSKDDRSEAEKWLDSEMDRRGANEQGVESALILRDIAIELAENLSKTLAA